MNLFDYSNADDKFLQFTCTARLSLGEKVLVISLCTLTSEKQIKIYLVS
jgi:hypothetical protein